MRVVIILAPGITPLTRGDGEVRIEIQSRHDHELTAAAQVAFQLGARFPPETTGLILKSAYIEYP